LTKDDRFHLDQLNRFVERVKHAGRVHKCRAGVDADADAEGFCNFLPWIAITTACATARD